MTSLTRRYRFSASHRLHSERLSAEQNRQVFGKCNNPFGHGHNYALEVTVAGEIDARTGMVVPPPALDAYVAHTILSRLDHSNLNSDIAEFAGVAPTTENLGLEIGRWLRKNWDLTPPGGPRLSKVRLEETASNTVEIEFS